MERGKRKAMNRLSIEYAAIQLFSQKPFVEVSMNEIAETSGLSKRTVYKYFPSKGALISSIFETYQQKHYMAFSKAVSGCDKPEEILEIVIQTDFSFTKENLQFMRMLWSVNDEGWLDNLPEELTERILSWNKTIFVFIADKLKGLKLGGFMENCSVEHIVHYISAVNKGIFIQTHKGTSVNLASITPEELLQMEIGMFRNCFMN